MSSSVQLRAVGKEGCNSAQHIRNMQHYIAMRENEVMKFASTWMDLERTMLSGISQRERERQNDLSHSFEGYRKKDSMVISI